MPEIHEETTIFVADILWMGRPTGATSARTDGLNATNN